jgi:hypothetical protein
MQFINLDSNHDSIHPKMIHGIILIVIVKIVIL